MKGSTTYSHDKVLADEVVDLYVEHKMSAPMIAGLKRCSSLTILNILRSQGVEIRRRGTYERKDLDVDKISAMYQRGMSLSRIASELGVNQNTINYHLKIAGVKTRNNRKLSECDVRRILQEYDRKPTRETLARLATEFDVTVQAVRYHVTKVRVDTEPLSDDCR